MAAGAGRRGGRVLIWDRPNCGASDVCFEGASESEMQADTLAALLEHLDMAPAVIIGGSGGSRISLLAAARHPRGRRRRSRCGGSAAGPFGLMSLADALLLRLVPGRVDRRDGGGRRAPRVGRGARAEPGQPGALPRAGPGDVHRDDGAAGWRSTARARPTSCPVWSWTRPSAFDLPDPGVPQRRLRHPPHPGDVGAHRRDPAERPHGRAAVGRPRVGRAPGRADPRASPTGSSCAGRCSSRSSRSGRTKSSKS